MPDEAPSISAEEGEFPYPGAIASIVVDRLHGKFKYKIDVSPKQGQRIDHTDDFAAVTDERLTLLYGKNGTGKTSLLKLLFHGVSASPDRGHRTALARIRFREFKVTLANDGYVRYWRDSPNEAGSFNAAVSLAGGEPVTHTFKGEKDPGTDRVHVWTVPTQMTESEQEFHDALAALAIAPVFLDDTRSIIGDVMRGEDEESWTGPDPAVVEAGNRREVDVNQALSRVRRHLSQLAFFGTQAGSARVDTVYINVAGAIIAHSSKPGQPKKTLIPALQEKVAALNRRAARFQAYGLLPESPMVELTKELERAENKHGPVLTQVLTPHLDGFEQRLDALEPGLRAVAAFIDALNGFLNGKTVQFKPGRTGLYINDDDTGERIAPSALSSGEKQIVLMFSDIIALQGKTRLFIIDEPELSLNPDWQRILIPSLLRVTDAAGMQIVVATHSIEIMARYQHRRRLLSSSST